MQVMNTRRAGTLLGQQTGIAFASVAGAETCCRHAETSKRRMWIRRILKPPFGALLSVSTQNDVLLCSMGFTPKESVVRLAA